MACVCVFLQASSGIRAKDSRKYSLLRSKVAKDKMQLPKTCDGGLGHHSGTWIHYDPWGFRCVGKPHLVLEFTNNKFAPDLL